MRQLFLDKEAMVMKEVAQPYLEDRMVLVSVYYSFVCSSDELAAVVDTQEEHVNNVPHKVKKLLELVTAYSGGATAIEIADAESKTFSCSGRVVAVGKKVQTVSVGDWVACARVGHDSSTSMLCVSEESVVRLQAQENLRCASVVARGAVALQSIRRARLSLGEQVCIFGLGLMGQLLIQLAKAAGCTVIAIDVLPDRLALAKQLGADSVYHAQEEDIIKSIRMATHHYGVDAVFVTADMVYSSFLQQSLDAIMRIKSRIVVVGLVDIELACATLYKKEIKVAFSHFATGEDESRWNEQRNMQAFVQLIENQKINIEALISADICIDTLSQNKNLGNKNMSQANGQINGLVIRHAQEKDMRMQPPLVCPIPDPVRFSPAVKDTIRLGFVGVGNFSKKKLLPLTANKKNVRIEAIFDSNMADAVQVSRHYGTASGTAKVYAREQELFVSDDVDAVIIASPHTYHCAQVLHALQQGKAVFLENPMATTYDQLQQLRLFLSCYKQAPLCIDYNRSFSPFIKKIKTITEKRSTPLTILYRMNVGMIPKENWIQTELGAGRIIGEASHIIDLFCFLTGARPVSVSVETMHAARDDLFPTDNFSAQIRFDDGSLCVLVYTALGHPDLGKERMEVFVDGKTMVLDDYIRLFGFGVPSWFNETVLERDKGHEALLDLFLDRLRQPEFVAPISLDRLCMVAELSLLIDQLACEGGGFKAW